MLSETRVDKLIMKLILLIMRIIVLFIRIMIWAVKWGVKILLYLFVLIKQATISLNSRRNDYGADKFAYDIGYGENLLSALYVLQNSYKTDKPDIMNKIKESSPILPKRIGRLERLFAIVETE